ncbi:MAG: ribonuclease E/G [Alphaproteobacteria bacterium]
MTKRMLIDATHAEETRVVVLSGNRLDEFDFDTSTKKQLKGNIYLAKVTRVEPSLQSAFVEYGGNRHGFLSFNEIHPDYYQIPIADRKALAAQEAKEQAAESAAADARADAGEGEAEEASADGKPVEVVSGEEIDDINRRRVHPSRRYKIQEVIKRRQIMLVQVVKEERGNKGAALTSYLSLAGRYCVLMPNTARGGGISRKIVNPDDRKRLKAIAAELPVPEGVGVILRTAGLGRTKAEIKRDFKYLMNLWHDIRELTLKSIAPALINEEANLINRSIRDLYTKDIEEVLVDGEDGYRMAKDFMRRLMPSHAKRVIQYDERIPLYYRYQVEGQLDAMHSPVVRLKSGGYIVLNPTEALVAIDVNSGRATRERNIEETAHKTNLEAAEEIARELRLRDLAGLIVIDFIDMEDPKNNRTVERRFKEAMKHDRARIQMGHISPFGLLELSRQRLRPSLLESSTQVCPHCGGTGRIRSTESTALHVLRVIEEEGIRERSHEATVHVPSAVALYILNQKRAMLNGIEERYGLRVTLAADDSLIPPDYRLERVKTRGQPEEAERIDADDEAAAGRKRRRRSKRPKDEEVEAAAEAEEQTAEEEAGGVGEAAEAAEAEKIAEAPRKRRRRGKRGGRRRRGAAAKEGAEAAVRATSDDVAEAAIAAEAIEGPAVEPEAEPEPEPERRARAKAKPETERPKTARRPRRKKAEAAETEVAEVEATAPEVAAEVEAEAEAPTKKRARRPRRKTTEPVATDAAPEPSAEPEPAAARQPAPPFEPAPAAPVDFPVAAVERETRDEPKPEPRRGWWQKLVE